MKKQIRLIVESLFDDEFDDIYNEDDLDIELSSKLGYNYYPTTFNELRELLKQLLEERGKDADLNDINVSQITTFFDKKLDIGLFEDLDPHNIDISNWDVSNVTDMVGTFYYCVNFNCDLSKWNVSNVKTMASMFYECNKFNSNLSNWDTHNVTNMYSMFMYCNKFKGNGLENWNVSNVIDMSNMFRNCISFNCDLKNWNVKKVKNMFCMFNRCLHFKGMGLENWEINDNTDTEAMLKFCSLIKVPSWYKYEI